MAAGTLAGPMISDGTWRHHIGDTNLNRMCNLGTFPEDVVAVVGCGGLGSAAIQGAVHAGARAVIAIDTNQSKIDRALKIGATHGCTTTLDAAFTILPDLTWGKNCDVVIITVGE